MIIYALIIIAILFFLSWNLIDNPETHMVTSLVTTIMFLVAVFFAIANFGYHYGMHKVTVPQYNRRIMSTSPNSSLKTLVYRPMGDNHDSQLIVYRNEHNEVVHTEPDMKVTNRIVRNDHITSPHVNTKLSKWTYRNSWYRSWFNLVKRPSTDRIKHIFYVPRSWQVLSVKQTLALKQFIKNRGNQQKRQMNTRVAKREIDSKAKGYVQVRIMTALKHNPHMSMAQKKQIMNKAIKEFKAKTKQDAEQKLMSEALKTVKSAN